MMQSGNMQIVAPALQIRRGAPCYTVHVLAIRGLGARGDDVYFLFARIHQVEPEVGSADGQRQAWKTTARAHVDECGEIVKKENYHKEGCCFEKQIYNEKGYHSRAHSQIWLREGIAQRQDGEGWRFVYLRGNEKASARSSLYDAIPFFEGWEKFIE